MKLKGALLAGLALLPFAVSYGAYYDLGTSAPPASVGGCNFVFFNTAPQAAIPDHTLVSTIPGAPAGYTLTTSYNVDKRTVPTSWGTWSHSYTGPVFFTGSGQTTLTLTISPAVESFMLYVEPNDFGIHNCTVTTDAGDNSGPVLINGFAGARGFAFVHPSPVINTITITCDAAADGFSIGEFAATCSAGGGGAQPPPPNLSNITSEFGNRDMVDFKNVALLTRKGPAIIRIESQSPIFISGIRINEFSRPALQGASLKSNAMTGALQPSQEQNFILDLNAGERPCGAQQFNLSGYCTVGIIFEPKSEGKKEAFLEVYYNTPNPVRIYITGTGVSQQSQPQPQPSPQPPGAGGGGSSGGSGSSAGTGSGGGGGCSMVSNASPINALAWLMLPGAALLRRLRRS